MMGKRVLWVLMVVAVSVLSCAKEETAFAPVRIAAAIQTRATGLHFDLGDRIGLSITKTSGIYAENKLMTYDGTAFAASDLLWYNDLREQSTLTAYYPYADSGLPTEFSIASDQTASDSSSDLLGAVKSAVVPGAAPVGMLFYHLLSQVNIVVTNSSAAAVTSITLGGFVPVASVDFVKLTSQAKSGVAAAVVKPFVVEAGLRYRVVLVPQAAPLLVTVETADGKTRTKTLPAAALESGKRYDLPIEVTPIDIRLSLSGEINDWVDGGSLGEDGGNASDGTLSYEGEKYRTVTLDGRLWMAENLRYKPAGVALGSGLWEPVGGTAAVASQGMLYNRATALAGQTVTADLPVRGICPLGWHIPDSKELETLSTASCGADFFCCAGYWITTGNKYGAATKGYLMCSTLTEDKMSCLSYTDPLAGRMMTTIFPEYGISLRCVRDAS